jgi:hypothetical protein
MDSTNTPNEFYAKFEKLMQSDISDGWRKLLRSERYQDFKAFALFLDGLEEFQNKHRKKVPHPPHEFSAREMGIPFMKRVNSLGLFMDHWFPGDFYTNSEEVEEHTDNEEVHARIFCLTLLSDKAQNKLCKIALKFPHSHEGFDFKEPKLKIIEVYESNPEKYFSMDFF